jgi:hypothetical protein
MSCVTCLKNPKEHFFSSYINHVIEEYLKPDDKVPSFCSPICLLNWVSIKTNRKLDDVKRDFENFCR